MRLAARAGAERDARTTGTACARASRRAARDLDEPEIGENCPWPPSRSRCRPCCGRWRTRSSGGTCCATRSPSREARQPLRHARDADRSARAEVARAARSWTRICPRDDRRGGRAPSRGKSTACRASPLFVRSSIWVRSSTLRVFLLFGHSLVVVLHFTFSYRLLLRPLVP